jgi:hypothetical protein
MYGGKQPDQMDSQRILEAVFQPELSLIFRCFPTRSYQKVQEIGRNPPEKNPDNFRSEYCFHIRGISVVFLRHTVTFSHLTCGIWWPESSTWEY